MTKIRSQAMRSVELARKYVKVDPAVLAVEAIEADISDRGVIKNMWFDIEDEIREEIKEVWIEIIKKCHSKKHC